MSKPIDQPSVKTLGEWLSSLRPGDACVCCGAEMRSADPRQTAGVGRLRGVPSTGRSQEEPSELVCPKCGCEVSAEGAPMFSVWGRDLNAAA